jgi:hypothetical protein
MKTVLFGHITLNRIGAVLFVVAILFLAGGTAGLIIQEVSSGSTRIWIVGLTGGQALLLGLSSLVFSAMIFGLASTQERLARMEAKLDAAIKARTLEEQSGGDRAE